MPVHILGTGNQLLGDCLELAPSWSLQGNRNQGHMQGPTYKDTVGRNTFTEPSYFYLVWPQPGHFKKTILKYVTPSFTNQKTCSPSSSSQQRAAQRPPKQEKKKHPVFCLYKPTLSQHSPNLHTVSIKRSIFWLHAHTDEGNTFLGKQVASIYYLSNFMLLTERTPL